MRYYSPRYWGVWLLFGLMRAVVWLPYRWQLAIGRTIGRISYYFAPHRRDINRVNLSLCYPDLSEPEREALVKRCFESVAIGMIEVAMAWWMPIEKLQNKLQWRGTEHIDGALAAGKNIILAGAHYTCLEVAGRLFSLRYPYHLLYRPHKNALFDAFTYKKRSQNASSVIPRQDMRAMLKALKSGVPVWFAPDQDYGRKYSVFAPFFGLQAASVTSMSRMAKHADAVVIPITYHRLPNAAGYEYRFLPPLTNYPSGDLVKDATQYNQVLEQDLANHPDQYLWQHRRFKTRPEGEPYLYKRKKKRKSPT